MGRNPAGNGAQQPITTNHSNPIVTDGANPNLSQPGRGQARAAMAARHHVIMCSASSGILPAQALAAVGSPSCGAEPEGREGRARGATVAVHVQARAHVRTSARPGCSATSPMYLARLPPIQEALHHLVLPHGLRVLQPPRLGLVAVVRGVRGYLLLRVARGLRGAGILGC